MLFCASEPTLFRRTLSPDTFQSSEPKHLFAQDLSTWLHDFAALLSISMSIHTLLGVRPVIRDLGCSTITGAAAQPWPCLCVHRLLLLSPPAHDLAHRLGHAQWQKGLTTSRGRIQEVPTAAPFAVGLARAGGGAAPSSYPAAGHGRHVILGAARQKPATVRHFFDWPDNTA
jgi:hypothetical protein